MELGWRSPFDPTVDELRSAEIDDEFVLPGSPGATGPTCAHVDETTAIRRSHCRTTGRLNPRGAVMGSSPIVVIHGFSRITHLRIPEGELPGYARPWGHRHGPVARAADPPDAPHPLVAPVLRRLVRDAENRCLLWVSTARRWATWPSPSPTSSPTRSACRRVSWPDTVAGMAAPSLSAHAFVLRAARGIEGSGMLKLIG